MFVFLGFCIVTFSGFILLILFRNTLNTQPKNFPPGPRELPIVGSTLFFGSSPHLTGEKWKEQYGDTYSLYFGRQATVIMNNPITIAKVFHQDAASGRNRDGKPGLVNSQGLLWKTHRRFALSTLRNLGMGKNWLEDSVLVDVRCLCEELKKAAQNPCDPKIPLTNSVANVICALIFGQRFSLTDPRFSLLTEFITQNTEILIWRFIAQTLPFLKWFPNCVRTKLHRGEKNRKQLCQFLTERIRQHETALHRGELSDFLSAYQAERENTARSQEERDTFTEKQLLASLLDLFSAGTETTSTTLLWGLVFLVENPNVMKRIHEEIDKRPCLQEVIRTSERDQMPYTDCVISEIQRCGSILPLGGMHKAGEAMAFDGYLIPKGTLLAANLYAIHHDPRWWNDPEKFLPERFIDGSGKISRPFGFIPFSLGKRACPGEALAKMELFLFLSNLLRIFTLRCPDGAEISSKNCSSDVTCSPKPFKLIFISRSLGSW